MSKILGLDIGERRIGVALADDSLISAYGVVDNVNFQSALSEIIKIGHLEQVEKIIIGVPKSKNTLQADKIHSFTLELAKNLNLPIEYVDEAFTSVEAERQLKGSKLKPQSEEFKQEVDKIAAKLILEQYLSLQGKV